MCDPQRPHGLQPSRLLRPWDFPGKTTGVGGHCLLLVIPWENPNQNEIRRKQMGNMVEDSGIFRIRRRSHGNGDRRASVTRDLGSDPCTFHVIYLSLLSLLENEKHYNTSWYGEREAKLAFVHHPTEYLLIWGDSFPIKCSTEPLPFQHGLVVQPRSTVITHRHIHWQVRTTSLSLSQPNPSSLGSHFQRR